MTDDHPTVESMLEEPSRRRFLKATAAAGGVAGVGGLASAQTDADEYDWIDATLDAYWYSLYNMNTTIAVSGVGVLFPHNEEQQQMFEQRLQGILENSDVDQPPIANPNLNVAPFTGGDPHFTQEPVAPFTDPSVQRIDASTMAWDREEMTHVVSPASVAWTHLKGVTWAKNFQNHFERLPDRMAAKFRAQMLGTVAQLSIKTTLIDGGPDGNGALTMNDEGLTLISGFNPTEGRVVDPEPRPMQHAAMLWFLSDMVSFAKNGWYGYVNPEPLVPPGKIQRLTDDLAWATMSTFMPEQIAEEGTTRDFGLLLGAMGWYGTHAGIERMRELAAEYSNLLAGVVTDNITDDGLVENGGENQAATQGAVGQGLLWASQVDGVDYRDEAETVLGYLIDDLWDEDAGTFATGVDDDTYATSARDAGDVTGGLNAADAVLGMENAQDRFATYFNQTFNRGRLQRAQRPASMDEDEQYQLPLPQDAGGEFGQAAVYNTEVTYDRAAYEWAVTDDRFRTEQALYLANQDIWLANWGGDFYSGRGVPGETDEPEERAQQATEQATETDTESTGDADFRLGGAVPGWQGRAPAAIDGETNPTLSLQPGTEYVLVWENGDGARHNFAIENEAGDDVLASEFVSEEGATQTVRFTASEEMASYYCQVHPQSMRGSIEFQG